ncbi:hypothetical protein HDU67_004214 [Dinochytrium kinnereticum]|nr:hypothetical protein HDU67_004214 [Dinochytrium kinnereticum]
MQDYLPVKNLKHAVTLNFQDDRIEDTKPFDSNLDFWEYCYEAEKKKYNGVCSWHIPKNMDLLKADGLNSSEFIFSRSDIPTDDVVQKRRNRRLFLAKEADAYKIAGNFEKRTAFIDYNAALSRASDQRLPNSQDPSSDEEDLESRMLNEDLIRVCRIASETALLPTGAIRPESPTTSIENIVQVSRLKKKDEKVKSRLDGPHIQEARKKERRAVDPLIEQALRGPQHDLKKLSSAELERRRDSVKRKLFHSGVALPNSVVKKETPAEQEHRPTRRATMIRNSDGHPSGGIKALFPSKGTSEEASEKPPEPVKPPPKQSIAGLIKKMAAPPPANLPPPIPKYIVPSNRTRGNKPVKFITTPEPEDILPVRDYDIFRRESNTSEFSHDELGHRASHVEGLLEDIEDIDEEGSVSSKKKSSEGGAPDIMEEAEEKLDIEEKIAQMKVKQVSVKRPSRSEKPTTDFKPQPPVIFAPQVMKQPTGLDMNPRVSRNSSGSPFEAKVRIPSPPEDNFLGPSTTTSGTSEIDLESSIDAETLSSKKADNPVENLHNTSPSDAEAYAWNLIRTRNDSYIPQALIKISSLFWFPKVEGQLNLSNVIQMLIKLVRDGLWSEVCEASKALLFLYRTFKEDILDPMALLVRPQLEAFYNPNWQVRAQLCSNVAAYGIFNSEVIGSIIHLLNDKHPEVRACAIEALAQLDINTKDKLLAFLIKIGLMHTSKCDQGVGYSSRLDVSLLIDEFAANKTDIGSFTRVGSSRNRCSSRSFQLCISMEDFNRRTY